MFDGADLVQFLWFRLSGAAAFLEVVDEALLLVKVLVAGRAAQQLGVGARLLVAVFLEPTCPKKLLSLTLTLVQKSGKFVGVPQGFLKVFNLGGSIGLGLHCKLRLINKQ